MTSFAWLFADWPFWASGLLIGLVIVAFAAVTGRGLGVSRGLVNVCALASKDKAFADPDGRDAWRLSFLLGLPLGVALLLLGAGQWTWRFDLSQLPSARLELEGPFQYAVLLLGGLAIGYGARKAGGCTSGHAITGVALMSRTSLFAMLGFMVGAIATAQLWNLLIGAAA